MKKKVISGLLCLTMVLALFGCKKKEDPKEQKTEPKKVEAVEETTEGEKVDPDPENMNLLTGLATLSPQAIGKRPVAVMVNNIEPALIVGQLSRQKFSSFIMNRTTA